MKQKLLLALLALFTLGGSNLYAQQEPVNDGVYYLYNTETGKFLTRGNNWGTQAVTNEVGSPWKVTVADGKYTLRMLDIVKDGSSKGLGDNGYSDNDNPIAFTPSGDANGYKLTNGDNYLCSPDPYGGGILYNDPNYYNTWQFLNVNEYKAKLAAKTATQEVAVAQAKGVSLGNNTLANLVGNADEWRHTDVSSSVPFPSNSSWTRTDVPNRPGNKNQGDYGVENYQGGGTYSYTATGLAKGIYKVGIRAMYRSTSNAICLAIGNDGYVNSSAYFSANGNIVQIKDWYSSHTEDAVPNSTSAFVTIANNGGYYSEVFAYVGDEGTLELKAVSESYWGASWFLFNGVTLTYYDNSVSDEDIAALVATIPTEIPTAVANNLNQLKGTLESSKTIADYNALAAAIDEANSLVAPYAEYLRAREDAQIAHVADATINTQDSTVANATTIEAIQACTDALKSAAAAAPSSDITAYTIKNPNPVKNSDDWNTSVDIWTFDSANNCAEFWNQSGATIKQTINLPAGDYCLTVIALQRLDMTGTIEANGKVTTIVGVGNPPVNNLGQANTWFNAGNGKNTVYFHLDEAGDVTIGINADNANGDHWTVFRSFALSTFTESVAASYLKPGYDEALEAAQAYLDQDMFEEDKAALQAAISDNTVDEATATVALYEQAITNLNAATAAAAVAVQLYTTYNNVVTAISGQTNVDLTEYVINGDFETGDLTAWTSVDGGNVANNGNFSLHKGTWFAERWKNNEALGNGSLTHDVIKLPAGAYRINADAQNIEQYNSSAAGTGLFLCANDVQTEIGAAANYQVYVQLTDKQPLTIKFVQNNCTGNWISFDNVKLTYLGEDFVPATPEDYAALNEAINSAEAKTIGFDEGEYAPYNNIAAVETLAEAKAIDQNAENSKEVVTSATTALTSATWTVNTSEVNAVYNGTFAATENNNAPAGWISTKNGAFSGQYMPRVFNNDDRLSEFNETKSAFFIRFDGTNSDRGTLYKYGETDGFTMPLKANTTYYVKADVKGWGSKGKPQRMNIGGPESFAKYNELTLSDRADTDDNAPQQLLIVFTTTTAGNYVISFQCPGSDDNKHNAVVSNIELFRVPSLNLSSDATVAPEAKIVANITTDRTLLDGLNTIVLPFNTTKDEIGATTVLEYTGTTTADGTVTMNFKETETLNANVPYAVMLDVAATEPLAFENKAVTPSDNLTITDENGQFNFVGTYVDIAKNNTIVAAGDYVAGATAFKKAKGGNRIAAFRAYLKKVGTGDAKVAFNFDGIIVDGIEAIELLNKFSADGVYNLQGQKVNHAQKGVYIVNGKKVVIK